LIILSKTLIDAPLSEPWNLHIYLVLAKYFMFTCLWRSCRWYPWRVHQ